MTIATVGRRFTYAGNGVTTAFSFPRLLLANTDITVYLTDAVTDVAVLQTLITHYSVAGMGDPAGVTVTFVTPPPTGKTVVLYGVTPKTQSYDPTDVGFLTPLGTEDALDKLAVTIQELSDLMVRSVQLAPGSTYGGSILLPKPVANYVLAFAGDALSLIATPLVAGPPGTPGTPGSNGVDGRTLLNGVGAPGAGLGANGDFYIETVTSTIYGPKTAGAWGAGTSLIGPPGPAGSILGPTTNVNDELVLWSGVNSTIKRSTGTGFPQLAAGVVQSYYSVPAGSLVGTTASQTLTNKTLTSPVINSPTNIVKGDVGLGNVDNTSDATKNAAAVTLTNKTITAPAISSPTGIVQADIGGLGTGDSPQHLAINLGHASDTTLTRVSAGDMNIEGNIVYRAGGTDVPAADGGTGRSSHTAYTPICGGTTTTAAQQSVAALGNSGDVLTSNGAGALPTFQANSGASKVVQVVNTIVSAVSSSSATIPDDDTIPQSGEGAQLMTLAITPTNVNNKLRIDVVVMLSSNTANRNAAALFQDATANALAAGTACIFNSGDMQCLSFTHYMTAGTVSATTFKVRGGGMQAGTMTFNGEGGARIFGGKMASSITITEYLP